MRIDAPILPPEAWHPDDGNKLTIYQLRQGDCHWPLGEMLDHPPFLYCGKQAFDGDVYCPEHMERAHGTGAKR